MKRLLRGLRRPRVWFALAIMGGLLLLAAPALAAPICEQECILWPEHQVWLIAEKINQAVIDWLRRVAGVFWWIDRFVVYVLDTLINQPVWTTLRDAMFEQLRNVMPTAIVSIMRGNNGLFIVALGLAGLAMMFPWLNGRELIDAKKVLIYAALLSGLFVSSVAGYDLVEFLEQTRVTSMKTFSGGTPTGASFANAISGVMRASPGEAELNFSLEVPAQFAENYFPKPEPTDYISMTVIFHENDFLNNFGVNLGQVRHETEASMTRRTLLALQGALMGLLSLIPAFALALLGAILAALTAAAYVLIMAFFAGLPLGLFEFGRLILKKIILQYIVVWTLSIAGSFATGFIVQLLSTQGAGDFMAFAARLPLILILIYVLWFVLQSAVSVANGTWQNAVMGVYGSMLAGAMLGPNLTETVRTSIDRAVRTSVDVALIGAALGTGNPMLSAPVVSRAIESLAGANVRRGVQLRQDVMRLGSVFSKGRVKL